MKLNKLFLGLLAMVGLVLASCSEDKYTPAEILNTAQVYFSTETKTNYDLPMSNDMVEFDVPVQRVKTDDKLTVNIVATGADGDTINVAKSVTFEEGSNKAMLYINVKTAELGYDNFKTINLSISDEANTTPYGYSNMTIVVGVPAPWVSLGKATYIDQFVGCFYGVDNLKYEVELQENNLVPGYYRLVYPYDGKFGYNDPGDWDDSKTYYLEIHAEDPDKVYIETQSLGMAWSYGMWSAGTLAGYYLAKGDEASASAYYGTLKDGILTFPASSLLASMADYQNGGLYTCGDGTPILVLPGYTLSDYTLSIAYEGIFTNIQQQASAVVYASFAPDVTLAKAVVVPAGSDPAAVADAIAAGELEAQEIHDGDNNYISIGDATGDLMVVAVSLDGDEVKDIATASFEYYGGGANPWKSLGMGLYTEDFVSSMFTEDGASCTYEVEVLESTEEPGRYRLVNPYGAAFPLNEVDDYDPAATNYLEINATDPDGVYIPTQEIGLDYGYGPMAIASWGYYYYENGYDFATLKENGYLGTLKDGVITLPTFKREDKESYYQALLYMGTSGYYAGVNGAFKLVLPGYVTSSAKAKAAKANKFVRRSFKGEKMTMSPVNKNIVKSSVKKFK